MMVKVDGIKRGKVGSERLADLDRDKVVGVVCVSNIVTSVFDNEVLLLRKQ